MPPASSVFTTNVVAAAPEDPLFGLAQAFRQDPSDKKIDLVIGAYRDDHAKPWILPVVKKVCSISPAATSPHLTNRRTNSSGTTPI